MIPREILTRSKSELLELIQACMSKPDDEKYSEGFKGFLIVNWDGNMYRQFDNAASNILIIEHRLPAINGIEATKNIMARYPKMRIIVVSMDENVEKDALDAGAIRFLKNPISFIDLQKNIDEISRE